MSSVVVQILEKALLNLDAAIKVVRCIRAEDFEEAAKYAEAQGALAKHIEQAATSLQSSIEGDERL